MGERLKWWKSRRSGNGSNCVEVAELRGFGIAVRDSKDKDGPVLTFDRAAWEAFIAGAKDGEFD